MKDLLIAALIALPCSAIAQVPPAPRSDGPAEPPSTIARSMCDALAGAERRRCLEGLTGEPQRMEPEERGRRGRSCDDLLGPEKEACMKKGGRIKAGVGASLMKH